MNILNTFLIFLAIFVSGCSETKIHSNYNSNVLIPKGTILGPFNGDNNLTKVNVTFQNNGQTIFETWDAYIQDLKVHFVIPDNSAIRKRRDNSQY